MSQEKFWVLLSKKLSGEATAEELQEFHQLVIEHPEWQYAIQNLEDLWKHQHQKESLHAEDAFMLHLHRMEEMGIPFDEMPAITPATIRTSPFKWYWSAAAVAVLAITGFFFLNRSGKTQSAAPIVEVNEITTRLGSKSKVQLPDGSMVWLNSGSKLTYNKEYGQQIREVTLSGEGYFDVVKNKEKPFVIHTTSINIKVLGTAFNVKAYPEDGRTETSLIRGSIEVTIKNRPSDKIILSPSEKLVVENSIAQQSVHNNQVAAKIEDPSISTLMSINKLNYKPEDSTVAETQWIDNRLVFRDESFKDVAVRMERWYDVEIEIQDERLLDHRLNGNFSNETIDQALEALRILNPFRYEKKGNRIIIHR